VAAWHVPMRLLSDKIPQRDHRGRQVTDAPPIWHPYAITAVDVVSDPDACTSFLGLPLSDDEWLAAARIRNQRRRETLAGWDDLLEVKKAHWRNIRRKVDALYSADQPRDDSGKWTESTGGAVGADRADSNPWRRVRASSHRVGDFARHGDRIVQVVAHSPSGRYHAVHDLAGGAPDIVHGRDLLVHEADLRLRHGRGIAAAVANVISKGQDDHYATIGKVGLWGQRKWAASTRLRPITPSKKLSADSEADARELARAQLRNIRRKVLAQR
jgi:hypothetical protein